MPPFACPAFIRQDLSSRPGGRPPCIPRSIPPSPRSAAPPLCASGTEVEPRPCRISLLPSLNTLVPRLLDAVLRWRNCARSTARFVLFTPARVLSARAMWRSHASSLLTPSERTLLAACAHPPVALKRPPIIVALHRGRNCGRPALSPFALRAVHKPTGFRSLPLPRSALAHAPPSASARLKKLSSGTTRYLKRGVWTDILSSKPLD
ncbi:hypothetical protein DFH06DRAFT_534388 [Mycena polygramma]|nr:hypothetical protein DFH06DRAFT_534388 [Mycena polygramma]